MEPTGERSDDNQDSEVLPAERGAAMEPTGERSDDLDRDLHRRRAVDAAMEPTGERSDDLSVRGTASGDKLPQWSRPASGRMTWDALKEGPGPEPPQ